MQTTAIKDKKVSTDLKVGEEDSYAIYIVIAFFLVATMAWKILDHAIPIWDSADHLLKGYLITDIIRSPSNTIFKPLEILTASFYYPPFFYFIHSAIILTFGMHGDRINDIPNLLFFLTAMYSLYKLGCTLLKDTKSATMGVLIFCTLPAVCKAVHAKALLDMPLTAMVFTGLWILVSWRENPNWKKAFLAGISIGLAALTKQYGLFYFVPPLLFWLAKDLLSKKYEKVAMNLSISSIAGLIFSLWLIPNFNQLISFMAANHRNGQESSFFLMWFNNAIEFFKMFPVELTVPIISFFVMSFILKEVHKKLIILSSSVLFCMVIICALNWDPYQFRYILPLTGYISLAVGSLANNLILNSKIFYLKITGIYIISWSLFSFIYLNYTPYPIQASKSIDKILGFSEHRKTSKYTEPLSAVPYKDWGYDWLFKSIQKNKKVDWPKVCVLPDTFDYSTSGLQYLTRSRRVHVDFMTLRNWTTRGYEFNYIDQDLDQFDFFLVLKNQNKADGAHFINKQSKANYNNLIKTFDNLSKYNLIDKRILPDNSRLEFYEFIKGP